MSPSRRPLQREAAGWGQRRLPPGVLLAMGGAIRIVCGVMLTFWPAIGLTAAGVAAFHLAYSFPSCAFLIVVYLYCLAALARQRTSRRAFYFGLAIGLFCYAPQLWCFYNIFGFGAVPLWLVLAF